MALKAIMLRRQIDKKKEELENLRKKEPEFSAREAELEKSIDEASNDDEEAVVNDEIDKFEKEKKEHEDAKTALENEITDLEGQLDDVEKDPPEGNPEENANGINKKGGNERTMSKANVNFRTLPMSQRALDAIGMEARSQILEAKEVKDFLVRLRDMKGTKRAISGGELNIPIVFLELISENMYRYSKLMNRVRVRNVKGTARQTIAGTIPEAVWEEMCGAINELSFGFHQITLDGFKVAGYIPVCNSLLEDSDVDLAATIIEMISESIAYAKDKAILYGKGPAYKMPTGIVTRLAQATKPSDYPASAPEWENLSTTNIITIDGDNLTGAEFWAQLMAATGNTYSRYSRGQQFWAMNSKTYAKLRSKLITFTANGDIAANIFGTLPIIGGDVDVLEFIPDNDIIGGYGDLYLWLERRDMVIESSEHVMFLKDNTVFRGKERADGAPIIPRAFVAINIANAAPTTVMDFAADVANDADVDELKLGSETLTPAFDPDVTSYTVTARAASAAVEVTTAQAAAAVEISYNGKNVKNGGTVTFEADGQAHPVSVTVKNGNAVKVYTINVTKAASK